MPAKETERIIAMKKLEKKFIASKLMFLRIVNCRQVIITLLIKFNVLFGTILNKV
jgi:hypothetical protein